jgi:hypothetical protein
MKKKLRKTTGQDEPYKRPQGNEVKSQKQGLFKGYSEDQMNEINESSEARKRAIRKKRK